MMFRRLVDLPTLAARKSVLFLGPRLTGKSTLARATLKDALYVDLLDAAQFRALAAHPEQLGEHVREHRRNLGSRRAFVSLNSWSVSWNMKSSGKRSMFRLTALFRLPVVTR